MGLIARLGVVGCLLLAACLPRVEDAPLTESGNAPVGWTPGEPVAAAVADGGATVATSPPVGTKCSGTANDLPSAATKKQYPCAITNLDLSNPVESHLPYASLTTSAFNLLIAKAFDLSVIKSLKLVTNLTVKGWNEPNMALPASIKVTDSISVYGNLQNLYGFDGVFTLNGMIQIANAPNLVTINAFSKLISVAGIEIRSCPKLQKLVAFSQLTSLKTFTMRDVQYSAIALPAIPVTTMHNIFMEFNNGLPGFFMFGQLQTVDALQIKGNPVLSDFKFPALKVVKSLSLIDSPNVYTLDGFGPTVQATSTLAICNTKVPGATQEAWRKIHAPNLPFDNCPNGCTGAACP